MMCRDTRSILVFWLLGVLGLFAVQGASAHEVRPVYLGLEEQSSGIFSVVWKRPVKDGQVPDLMPVFPEQCSLEMEPFVELTGDAKIERGLLTCDDPGLGSGEIRVPGLTNTLMDVLVHIAPLDGKTQQHMLKPGDDGVSLDETAPPLVNDYIGLGFEHIMGGYDHLLFVLALLLIVSGKMPIFKTVTAFTVAHSITLALAALGMVNLSPAPVEAIIALSIAFLAAEAIYMRRGRVTFTATRPWAVAFLFGLLHGLGFAGALNDVGLPQGDIPLALLFFNLGIEIGQLTFVLVVLVSLAALQRVLALINPQGFALGLSRSATVPAYTIGAIGVFWALERAVQIVT
jgi:hypothetical protein